MKLGHERLQVNCLNQVLVCSLRYMTDMYVYCSSHFLKYNLKPGKSIPLGHICESDGGPSTHSKTSPALCSTR